MQYKVPQNIDLEDRIIGPLTMKQFLYILVAGIIDYIAFLKLPLAAFLVIAIPISALALALALVKINDRPFVSFLWGLVGYLKNPKERFWHQGEVPEQVIVRKAVKKGPLPLPMKHLTKEELRKLAQRLDTR